jgi:hypothetical protein
MVLPPAPAPTGDDDTGDVAPPLPSSSLPGAGDLAAAMAAYHARMQADSDDEGVAHTHGRPHPHAYGHGEAKNF